MSKKVVLDVLPVSLSFFESSKPLLILKAPFCGEVYLFFWFIFARGESTRRTLIIRFLSSFFATPLDFWNSVNSVENCNTMILWKISISTYFPNLEIWKYSSFWLHFCFFLLLQKKIKVENNGVGVIKKKKNNFNAGFFKRLANQLHVHYD